MNRYLVLILVLATVFLSSWASGGVVGATSICANSECLVAASSSLVGVLSSIGLGLFLLCYRQRESAFDITKYVGVWRRFGAFYLDFGIVLMVLAPLLALLLLLAEAKYTGQFQWSFERDFSRPTDTMYLIPGIFVIFVGLYYYFYKHPQVNRQTIGQYVLGYRVTRAADAKGEPQYAVRVLLSFIGMCTLPISLIFALRNENKVFWWDKATNTSVVRLSAVNQSVQTDQPAAGR